MPESREGLKSRLRQLCLKKGAVVFGVASAAEADSLPRVEIGPMMKWLYGTKLDETRKPTEAMPDAKSVVVFGIPSTDDSHELVVLSESGDPDYPGYHPLNWIRRDAARFLEGEGHRVVYPYESSSPGSYKRVLRLAGVGAFGKNSLIITPEHGPWLRFSYLLTDAELEPDKPLEEDLCRDCSSCIEACPVDALTPYVVDAERCLVGVHLRTPVPENMRDVLDQYEPRLTPATHVMCTRCQLACPYTSASRRRNVVGVDRRPSTGECP
ncbi:MAG: 4Fe-4S binding protein [Thermoplasmata archaeon]|nr:4Fe-4S binding protein [Thermoplasmata archaeon]